MSCPYAPPSLPYRRDMSRLDVRRYAPLYGRCPPRSRGSFQAAQAGVGVGRTAGAVRGRGFMPNSTRITLKGRIRNQ